MHEKPMAAVLSVIMAVTAFGAMGVTSFAVNNLQTQISEPDTPWWSDNIRISAWYGHNRVLYTAVREQ